MGRANKGIKAQRVEPPTPTIATDALIGDKEHNRKKKKAEKERNRKTEGRYTRINK